MSVHATRGQGSWVPGSPVLSRRTASAARLLAKQAVIVCVFNALCDELETLTLHPSSCSAPSSTQPPHTRAVGTNAESQQRLQMPVEPQQHTHTHPLVFCPPLPPLSAPDNRHLKHSPPLPPLCPTPAAPPAVSELQAANLATPAATAAATEATAGSPPPALSATPLSVSSMT